MLRIYFPRLVLLFLSFLVRPFHLIINIRTTTATCTYEYVLFRKPSGYQQSKWTLPHHRMFTVHAYFILFFDYFFVLNERAHAVWMRRYVRPCTAHPIGQYEIRQFCSFYYFSSFGSCVDLFPKWFLPAHTIHKFKCLFLLT